MKVFCGISLRKAKILTSQNTLRLRFKGKHVHSQERGTLHPLTALATWDIASLNRLAISNYKINATLRYGFDNLCLRGGSHFFPCVNNLHAYCRHC